MGLQRLIDVVGGQAALAALVGVSPQAVHRWLRGGRMRPEYVLRVVRRTGGAITPHELRPDVYPDPDWMPPAQAAPAESVSIVKDAVA